MNKKEQFYFDSFGELIRFNQMLIALNSFTLLDIQNHIKKMLSELKEDYYKERENYTEEQYLIEDEKFAHGYREIEKSLDDNKNIVGNFLIVAAYSGYEITLKSIFKHSGKFNESEISNCYQVNNTTEYLNKKFSFKLEDVTNIDKINLLRILNNDIKHNGKVSKKLSQKDTYFKEGEDIKIELVKYNHIVNSNDILSFFRDLINKIKEKI
jgi:hypothetical protein